MSRVYQHRTAYPPRDAGRLRINEAIDKSDKTAFWIHTSWYRAGNPESRVKWIGAPPGRIYWRE
jgi:hypothetical protein